MLNKFPRFKYFIDFSFLFKSFVNLSTQSVTQHSKNLELNQTLSNVCNRDDFLFFSSYRMGVYFYLKSLNLERGTEVLLTPITIPDLVNVILSLGLIPKFCDLDIDSHTACKQSLKEEISEHTKVVILTYLSGCNKSQVENVELCKSKGCIVIEDISQLYGVPNLKSSAHAMIGSLSSGKVMTSFTGGFLAVNDKSILAEIEHIDEYKQMTAPPKKRFFHELFDNFKILLATNLFIFNFFTYYILKLLSIISPDAVKKIHETKFLTRSPKKDIFFDDIPIYRTALPSSWFTYFSNWQGQVLKSTSSNVKLFSERRIKLFKTLKDHISENVIERIPLSFLDPSFNCYYHLPIYVNKEERKSLFDIGLDNDGYGLNLCTEEKVFQGYWTPTPKAFQIKHSCVFVPLHESFTEQQVIFIAKKLNQVFNKGA